MAGEGKESRWIAWNAALGYALLRICLGVNIAMHGISRLLANPHTFAAGLNKQFAMTFLPAWSVTAFGLSLPWMETLIGLLILAGLFTRIALLAGGLLIVALTFGITLVQQWDIAGVQLGYGFIFAILLFLLHHNSLSLDSRLFRRPGGISEAMGEGGPVV